MPGLWTRLKPQHFTLVWREVDNNEVTIHLVKHEKDGCVRTEQLRVWKETLVQRKVR